MSPSTRPKKQLLLINPNSSTEMTQLIVQKLSVLPPSDVFDIVTYTAPVGPASIDTAEDERVSSKVVFDDIAPRIDDYDAFLVACYSLHPLVDAIKKAVGPDADSVIGIFETSIIAALAMLPPASSKADAREHGTGFDQFGIVTTGKYFEQSLASAARDFLRARGEDPATFAGVGSTGLHAGELHGADARLVEERLKQATRRLVRGRRCGVVILGCAAMSDLEPLVREAIVEELGDEEGLVHITDGVSAGIGMLEGIQEGRDGS